MLCAPKLNGANHDRTRTRRPARRRYLAGHRRPVRDQTARRCRRDRHEGRAARRRLLAPPRPLSGRYPRSGSVRPLLASQHEQARHHARCVGDIGAGGAQEAARERGCLRLRREDLDASGMGADVRRPEGGLPGARRRPGIAVRRNRPVCRVRWQQPHRDGDEHADVQHRRP